MADALVPLLGFVICLTIWSRLPVPAQIVDGAWRLIGLVYASHVRLSAQTGALDFDVA